MTDIAIPDCLVVSEKMSCRLVWNKDREELHRIAARQFSWQFEVFSDERKVFSRFAIYSALFDPTI